MRDQIELSREARADALKNLISHFQTERDEELSEFQASILLDFILSSIGPSIYNQAVTDAHRLMLEKIEDLYGLEKRPR